MLDDSSTIAIIVGEEVMWVSQEQAYALHLLLNEVFGKDVPSRPAEINLEPSLN